MNKQGLRGRLLEIAEDLRRWWIAALSLRIDRSVWDELAPALQGHHRTAGSLIGGWYRDAVLIRCRRLLAEGDRQEETPRRTLLELADVAEYVSVDLLVDAWMEQGTTLSRNLIEQQVETALHTAEAQGFSPFERATIVEDANRLREDHEVIVRFANRAVAHLDRRRHKTEPPSTADVDRLIDDMLETVHKYAVLIAGVHLVTDKPGVSVRPTVRALQLFDWRAYIEAVGEESERRYQGELWPSNARDKVEEDVAVCFVWRDSN